MSIERLVVARGAATGLLVGTPAAMANVFLADQDPEPKGLLNLTLLVLLVGFVVAGVVAGLEAHADATRHGALAGLLCFVPIQVIGVLGRLDRGDPLDPVQIVFLGMLATVAGTAGALLGSRLWSRPDPGSPNP